ncbi:MAG: alpha/beta hydrolase, partial [Spirochaetaceae bacterium]|nr:alpha/beta hydrolase [Spirochaetaceae bacterium]
MSIFKKSPKKKYFQCKRDELTIRGTEYRCSGKNLPIIILSHGFMANQDTVKQYAIELAKEGYAAYTFDFCGGCAKGKSDGKTSDMTIITEVKDLETVIEYAKALPYTDEKDITLAGCSQGGFVSALVASKRIEEISKLILFYPALCIPEDARKGSMLGTTFDPNDIPEMLKFGSIEIGKAYPATASRIDAYKQIRKFTKDVLILHGTADDIVPLKYSKHAYNEYMAERENNSEKHSVEFEIIKDGAHGFSKKHDKIAMQHVRNFLSKHNHKKCHKKRRNPVKRFFASIFKTIFFLIAVIALWCVFSAFHKKDSLSLLPANHSIYVNTESLWETIDPVIDLQATDILLSNPEMAPLRGAVVSFRKSSLRSSKLVSVIASRAVDAGFYMEQNQQNLVAVIDMGTFSAITRLAKFVVPYVNVEGLSLVQEDDSYRIEYATKTDT